eukprot:CAMPEP_0177635864 /NCGR_PEP_ID=MMETSP0447-20121125/4133_1 /TAXON_ID=0 /ORGANISM="Stygamoeba regulata, Strain BSH-02190019" /LENGTH=297 /DNA_ID=CAMNT_0019137689 /DNA_START=62 /DNA_END=955 /DNA_ORIENTATION=-
MKVSVIGAGFIGAPVALALRRAGHAVSVLARNPGDKSLLQKNEVTVHKADFDDLLKLKEDSTSTIAKVISASEAIVWCAVDNTKAVESVIDFCAKKNDNIHNQKKRFVLLSGCLMYIPSDEPRDEHDAVNDSLARFHTERAVLGNSAICGTVARPAFLYGGSSSYMGMWWKQMEETGAVSVRGDPNKVYNFVHANDLADGFARIVEAPQATVAGEIFNFGSDFQSSVISLATTLVRAAGFTGEVKVEDNQNAYDKYFDRTAIVDSSKARRILGWTPKYPALTQQPRVYYDAWKASRQ